MKKMTLLLSLCSVLVLSCFESEREDANDEMTYLYDEVHTEPDTNEELAEEIDIIGDERFPVSNIRNVGFRVNKKDSPKDGVAFFIDMDFTNNTNSLLTRFHIFYFMKVVFKDEETNYHPSPCYHPDDESKIFNCNPYVDFPKNDKWKPDETKNASFCITRYREHGHGTNFTQNYFERTPVSATLYYCIKGVGVDDEYEIIETMDILDHWKDYQSTLGLR